MSDRAYTKVRVVGCSSNSIEEAIELAIAKAGAEVHWFETVEIRGAVRDDKVNEWQVTVDLGVKLD